MADRTGFEPAESCDSHAFQACALNRSAICPYFLRYLLYIIFKYNKSKIFLSKKNFNNFCKFVLREKQIFLSKIFWFINNKNKKLNIKMSKIFLSNDTTERKYSINTIKSKHLEKEILQEKFWMEVWKKKFVLWFDWEITSENFWDEFLKSLEILLELDIQIVILAKSEKKFQEKIWELHEKFSNKFLVLADSEENLRDIYAISDSVLFLWVNDDTIMSAISYSTIPVILNNENLKIDLLEDFDPLREKWNSFFIKWDNFAFILEAVLRAKETFRFSYDWGVLKTHCLNTFKAL